MAFHTSVSQHPRILNTSENEYSVSPRPGHGSDSPAINSPASYRRKMSIFGSLGKSLSTSWGRPLYGSYSARSLSEIFQFAPKSPGVDAFYSALDHDKYCKDYTCCGLNLENLHDLVQHYEDCHLRPEEYHPDDDELPFVIDDDADMDMASSSSTHTHTNPLATSLSRHHRHPLSPQSNRHAHRNHPTSINPTAIYADSSTQSSQSNPSDRKRLASSYKATPRMQKKNRFDDMVCDDAPTLLPPTFDGPTAYIADPDVEDIEMSGTSPTTSTAPPTTVSGLSDASHLSMVHYEVKLHDHNPGSGMDSSSSMGGDSSSIQTMPFQTTAPMPEYAPSIETPAPAPAPAPTSPVSSDIENEEVSKDDRPHKCKIAGCTKAYKNPGGLKYHMQHGHCEDTGDPEMNHIISKPYQCSIADCGKRYKNLNGLKYHIEHAHISLLGPPSAANAQAAMAPQPPGRLDLSGLLAHSNGLINGLQTSNSGGIPGQPNMALGKPPILGPNNVGFAPRLGGLSALAPFGGFPPGAIAMPGGAPPGSVPMNGQAASVFSNLTSRLGLAGPSASPLGSMPSTPGQAIGSRPTTPASNASTLGTSLSSVPPKSASASTASLPSMAAVLNGQTLSTGHMQPKSSAMSMGHPPHAEPTKPQQSLLMK
ncbi:uncharacterized protein BJ171DRAFT_474711 [Polychytrium aggregatum]|uniref:uncharacterized protein n=1 Tax=Polychytrium aggregatum TaxID=110093 RepID=UPI0022FF2316|nr:uncharacterized protein BJ171DRAFT_474711 [Polychytrium aggregatum]KAI9204880.1 hypothetical protein BJ171DRAFT_474711 [Polychytrium aggregatum]